MSKDLEENKLQLFFDNFFSSPELLVYLMSRSIFAVATLRSDLNRDCPLPVEKDMKKNGRGNLAEFTDSKAGLVICAWYDNRQVLTISNFLGKDPISNCKRYDRKKRLSLCPVQHQLNCTINVWEGLIKLTCFYHFTEQSIEVESGTIA